MTELDLRQKYEIAVAALRQSPTAEALQALVRLGEQPSDETLSEFFLNLASVAEELELEKNWPLVRLEELGLYPVLTLAHWEKLQELLALPIPWASLQHKIWSGDFDDCIAPF